MAEIEIRLSPLTVPEPPPIVVGDEPLLIGREAQVFRSWKDTRLKKLSREHARLEINGPSASLCDLGSTNGTKINSLRLVASKPYPLEDGDIIDFANVFKYKVKIVRPVSTEDTIVSEIAVEPFRSNQIIKNKTMFMETADSYLDMLCEEDEQVVEKNNRRSPEKGARRWVAISVFALLALISLGVLYLSNF